MGKSQKKQKTEKSSKRKNSKKNKDEEDYVVESSECESDDDVAKEVEEEDEDEEENDEEKAPKVESESKKRGRNRSKKKKEAESPMKSEYDIADSMTVKTWNPVASDPPPQLRIEMLPFQRESLSWMQLQEEGTPYKGGILADDMGMGKTLQAIALLLQTKSEMGQYVEKELNDMVYNPINNNNADSTTTTTTSTDDSKHYPKVPTTLVVCPVVALAQWEAEISKYCQPNSLKVAIYHGSNRISTVEEISKYDVVLTSYSVVESDYRHEKKGFKRQGEYVKKDSLLHGITWFRVILDEAHSIKDRTCSTAYSVFALKAERRWTLTGTPLQNRIGELFSLIKFLQITPYSYYYCKKCDCKGLSWSFAKGTGCTRCGHNAMSHFSWWNKYVLNPIVKSGMQSAQGQKSMQVLKCILSETMLRRTKTERAKDLCLPPRLIRIRYDELDDEENDFYEALYTQSKTKFEAYVKADTVLNNYAHVFDLLLRLRQAVDHPYLVLHAKDHDDDSYTPFCLLCNDPAEEVVTSKCNHSFCRICIENYLENSLEHRCPECLRPMVIDYRDTPASIDSTKTKDTQKSILQRVDLTTWRSSTKIEALMEELLRIQQENPNAKSLVFSQFVNFLDLIEWRLKLAGFNPVKLDGRMNVLKKNVAINKFNNDPDTTVFLISLKAGGVALNLTAASHCFIMDPWWNPAAEFQAIDRVYRLGQFKCIEVIRFIIPNTIEDRIMQLQDKKHILFASTVGTDADALARLSVSDLKFLFRG